MLFLRDNLSLASIKYCQSGNHGRDSFLYRMQSILRAALASRLFFPLHLWPFSVDSPSHFLRFLRHFLPTPSLSVFSPSVFLSILLLRSVVKPSRLQRVSRGSALGVHFSTINHLLRYSAREDHHTRHCLVSRVVFCHYTRTHCRL